MKTVILTIILLICSVNIFGQVLKYKSSFYDIEKPNVADYETIHITTLHTFDFNRNEIRYEYFKPDGSKVTKKYLIKVIYDTGGYFRCSINSAGIKNIWLSKGLVNIEYEFSSGTKLLYYELYQIQ